MQQRRLRLGDILDDYCPRERRITNHAVVAMIEDDVRLTRCTTCDTEHDYKQGKAPTLRRKKDPAAAAYKEVLAEVTGEAAASANRPERVERVEAPCPAPEPVTGDLFERAAAGAEEMGVADSSESEVPPTEETEEARVHRRLIRATLPRTETQVTPRPIPQFTMRQPLGRPGKFRGAQAGAARGGHQRPGLPGRNAGNGNGPSRSAFGRAAGRPDGQRHQQARRGKKHSK